MDSTYKDTIRFIEKLWFLWGQKLLNQISKEYQLNPEQKEALDGILLRPNDWIVHIKPPMNS
jgi:hypothetical protein